MLLYHMNMGYPLLSESAVVDIPYTKIMPRNDHAKEDIKNSLVMEKPQKGYEERCYYYDVVSSKEQNFQTDVARVGIYNPDIKKGVKISYNKATLDCFTQWKMMGEVEYVLGLEPGNCTPDGRNINREKGILKFINPGEEYKIEIKIDFYEK